MTETAPALPRHCGLALLAAALLTASVQAQHWPAGQTIGVWIDRSHAPDRGELLVTRALAAWTAASGGRLTLQPVGDRAAASIRVRFASSATTFGETQPRMDPRTGALVSAEVTIANDMAGDPLTQRIAAYLTALHELGHALGLSHSDSFTSVMYRFRRPDDGERFFAQYRATLKSLSDIGAPASTGLSDEDVRKLRALYDR